MKRFFLSTILLSFIITSCKKDNDTFVEDQKNEEPQQTLVTDGVVGGRYQFSSSESLSKMMGELRNDEELLEKKMKELYLKGFRPKYPIGDIENDPELIKLYEGRPDTVDDETEEEKEEENMISDPLLASFIDENNEIVVKDTLYKFTTRGVFSSHLKDSLKLKNYLKERQPQLSAEELLKLRETTSGKQKVAEGVYRFIAPISELERNNIKEEQKRMTNLTPSNELQPIINGLPKTPGKDNWFLHTLFGESRVATEHFDKRHRVKIEFFNQNYGFYKSVGISVRNQTRRFRIWWASKANEVVLGILYVI